MRFRKLVAIAASTVLAGVLDAACAVDGVVEDNGADPGTDTADAALDASPGTNPASRDAGNTDASRADAPGDSARPDTGAADSGQDAAPDGSAQCAAANNCPTATALPQVSADTGNDVRTTQGTTSQWVQVLATEDNGNWFGHDLRIKATLASPPGTNFDLYLYQGPDAPGLACGLSPKATSVLAIGTDTVADLWSDNANHDDAKIVTFEVRHVSGACAPGAQWTLTVTGDTN